MIQNVVHNVQFLLRPTKPQTDQSSLTTNQLSTFRQTTTLSPLPRAFQSLLNFSLLRPRLLFFSVSLTVFFTNRVYSFARAPSTNGLCRRTNAAVPPTKKALGGEFNFLLLLLLFSLSYNCSNTKSNLTSIYILLDDYDIE